MNVDCTILRLLANAIKAAQYGFKHNRAELEDLLNRYLANVYCPPVDVCVKGDICVPIVSQICTISASAVIKECPVLSILDLGGILFTPDCTLEAIGYVSPCPTLTVNIL